MSESIAALFTRVAREVDAILDAARAADPEFDEKVEEFIGDADGAALRAVFDIKPIAAFRVEVLRQKGASIEGKVLHTVSAPPRDLPPRSAH